MIHYYCYQYINICLTKSIVHVQVSKLLLINYNSIIYAFMLNINYWRVNLICTVLPFYLSLTYTKSPKSSNSNYCNLKTTKFNFRLIKHFNWVEATVRFIVRIQCDSKVSLLPGNNVLNKTTNTTEKCTACY